MGFLKLANCSSSSSSTTSSESQPAEMDFSLYVIVSPKICRVSSEVYLANGLPLFDTNKIVDVINAGATAIQLREDSYIETSEFSKIAKAIHGVTQKHNIPLVIHDRVDIAVSSNAEGVELGKGCLDYNTARSLMGAEKFVGVAVTTERQAELAAKANSSYLVIGPVYKPLPGEFHITAASPLGTAGVRGILACCANFENRIPHLVSGGITPENIQRVVFQSKADLMSVDGVVLHYPVTEDHGKMLAEIADIKNLMRSRPKFLPGTRNLDEIDGIAAPSFILNGLSLKAETAHLNVQELLPKMNSVIAKVFKNRPIFGCLVPSWSEHLIGKMSAAIGAVPNFTRDFEDMGLPDRNKGFEGCLIHMDSIAPAACEIYLACLRAYNLKGLPVVFEPAEVSGPECRRTIVARNLMTSGYITLIKGNYTEILLLAGMAGLRLDDNYEDPTGPTGNAELCLARMCFKLALRERCVVLATGDIFILSDGERTVTIRNGSRLLANAGPESLGAVLAASLAVELEDPFFAVLTGLLLFTVTSDQATEGGFTKGPGTFMPAFIDELWKTSQAAAEDNSMGAEWTKKARVTQVEF